MHTFRSTSAALATLGILASLASPARAHVRCDDDAFGCSSRDDGGDYHDDYNDHDYPRPPVVMTVTRATVDAVLASAGLDACLEPLAGRHRATVRVYVATDGSTHVRARIAPRDEDAETCLRRTAEAALEWGGDAVRVRRAFSTRIALRTAATVDDAEPTTAGTEAVTAAVTSAHAALAACLDATGDGSMGTLTLAVHVARSGALVLREARVGRLVPDEEAGACLRDVVRALAVERSGERFDTTVDLAM